MTKWSEPNPPLRSPLTLRNGLFALGLLLAWSVAQAFQAAESGAVIPATGTIDVLFTPEQDAAGEIVQAIRQARKQILVQVFSFTHKDIAAALIAAHERGIDVQLLADAAQSRRMQRDKVKQMAAAGLPVWTDAEHQSAHNKVMVIDVDTPDAIVITGSYNFTFAAQFNNAENLLLFRGNQPLARLYRDNWQRHLRHAQRWNDH